MQRFNTNLFTWNAATKTACTEASDLARNFRERSPVCIYNSQTGVDTWWEYNRTITTAENEIAAWVLVPADPEVNTQIAGWEITVFND